MKIKDYKISNQINLTQVVIFLFILAAGIISYFTIDGLIKNSESLRNHPVVTQGALSSIKEDILSKRLLMEEIVLLYDIKTIQNHKEAINSFDTDTMKQLDILATSYLGPKIDLETLKSNILAYQTITMETLRLQSVGKLAEAKQRVTSKGISGVQAKEIINSAGAMETFANNKAIELYLDSRQKGNQALLLNIILLVVVLFITSAILILLKKNIMVPLNELGNDISGFKQGKIADRSFKVSENEISLLSNSFNLMAKEKEKHAAELLIANKELLFQNEEKIKHAAELIAAKTEISTQAALIIMQKAYYIDKQLYQATLLSIGDGVISCDINSNIIFINKVAEALTGWSQEEVIGQPIENIFNITHEVTHEKCENIVKQVIASKSVIELGLHTLLISKNGSEIPIEDSAAPIFNENGELAGAVLVFRDVTEKREAIRDIEYLSYHDKLTGLYNRRFYEEEIRRLDTKRNLPLTIVIGDANGLKLINDSFGHSIGDEFLQKAANAMKNGCRADDIIARLGGDEFVAILPNTDKTEADIMTKRIREYLSEYKLNGIPISISFGHGTKEIADQNIQEIFKNAEDDMYKQKLYESSSMRSKTVDLIMNTLYEKNIREMLHSKRVGEFCGALAIKMHFNNEDINKIRLAGLMHDIGKIAIDEGILNKVGKLTQIEFNEIKRHSEIGYRILSSVYEFSEIANFVLEHHERWDGQGYPKGLKGNQISIQGRMICVADAYDAMTRERTYKEKLNMMEAINEIRRCAGNQFDPDITKNFVEMTLEMSENSTN
ncbi:MAG: HD domain-containing phosphohydrolase [Actinomycetota bacterium]